VIEHPGDTGASLLLENVAVCKREKMILNKLLRPFCISVLVLFSLGTFSARTLADDDWTPGIQELYRLDRLPMLRESVEVASISSYDRTGGNNDGFGGKYSYVRKEKDALVLADLKGPGVIYRIWTPTPTDDVLEFYFDRKRQPAIKVKFRDLFMGRHPAFVRPLVGYGVGGFYSYVPLPYEKSCKVLIRAEKIQFYQINYATYSNKTAIKSFSPEPADKYLQHLEKAKTLFGSYGTDISSYTIPPGGKVKRFRAGNTRAGLSGFVCGRPPSLQAKAVT
jgi:hypothetical protein